MRLRSIQTDQEIGVGQVVEFLPGRKGDHIDWGKITDINLSAGCVWVRWPDGARASVEPWAIGAYFGNHPKTLAKRKHGQTKKQAQAEANKAADARENSLAGGRCSSTGLTGDARRAVEQARDMRGARAGTVQMKITDVDPAAGSFTIGPTYVFEMDEKANLHAARRQILVIDHEFDAIVAGLRLLAREVAAGRIVFPSDESDIGDIWTNAGEHEGLPAEDIHKLADRLLGN